MQILIILHPSISLSKAEDGILVNGTSTLEATVNPVGSTVTWSSSDEEVATVEDGVVTGVTEGTATITGSITVNNIVYSDTCEITVTKEQLK